MQIYGNYDVVVVGGGVSGCAAAIAAARVGAKVILIERFGTLGGMMNVVGPPGWAFAHLWNGRGEQIIGGLVEETHHRLEAQGLALPFPAAEDCGEDTYAFVDPDWWGLLIFEMIRENHVNLLLHSLAVDVLKDGDRICGVTVENTSGRMAVMGKVIIEATGEGDIAVRAGVPYSKVDRTKEELDPPSITFHMDGVDWDKVTAYFKARPDQFNKKQYDRLMKSDSILDLVRAGVLGAVGYAELTQKALDNGDLHPYGDLGHFFTHREGGHVQPVFQHSAQVKDCDTTDITEWTAGEAESRRQAAIAIRAVRKYLPGYENSYFTRLTSSMRTREGRHMAGDYQMQGPDVTECRKFPDVVAKCMMLANSGGPFHSALTPGGSLNQNYQVRYAPKDGGSYDIPYRSLVPKQVEGMLLAGKLISVSEDFNRDLLPENIISGQAAGVAAALCARDGDTPRELEKDVKELQAILVKQGAILTGTH
ncbi:MAG: FAD-dependent oxidoreductase [Peptococcaceae bacterium]|nr:FAD-dependent oxidoreductase [Peptococcaceae bacterium]